MLKQKIKIILSFVTLLIFPELVFGAPNISGVSGEILNGQSVTISGVDFETHSLDIESLNANIESGIIGQELSELNWTIFYEDDWERPLYEDDQSHSGSKSLKCTNYATTYNCAFAYDMPDVLADQKFYITWWTKYEGDDNGQWKMFRVSDPLSIVDAPQEVVMSNWFDLQRYVLINPTGPANDNNYMGDYYPKGDGAWNRIEFYFSAGSTNTANGSIELRITKDSGIINSQILTSKITHEAVGAAWKYVIWQNYFGNGHTNGGRIWFDDFYIQHNTSARIELCAGSTWANRGKCEIQVPSSWEESSISVMINTGNFIDGSNAYFYIVDKNDELNANGFPVVINSSESTSPSSPTGLSVI